MLARLARSYPRQTIVCLILLTLAGFTEGIGILSLLPLFVLVTGKENSESSPLEQFVHDLLESVGLTANVPILLCIIVAGILLKAVLGILGAKHIGFTTIQVMADLRFALVRAFLNARWSYFTRQPAGALTNALSFEAVRGSSAYRVGAKLIAETLQVLIYSVLAFFVYWQVAAVAYFLGFILFFVLRRLLQMSRSAGEQNVRSNRDLSNHFVDGINSIKPIKTMAIENRLLPLLEHETTGVRRAQNREVLSAVLIGGINEPLLVIFLAIGVYVSLMILAIPFAEVLFLAILFQRIVTRISTLYSMYGGLIAIQPVYWSINALIEDAHNERERIGGLTIPPSFDEVRFDDVTFNYGSEVILKNAQFVIPRRKMTAIIGPSGSGKTTLLDLFSGLYEPLSGEIKIGKTPLRDLDLHKWREKLGYVPQETIMFHDTISNNITLRDPDISDELVNQSLLDAGLGTFVANLPDGIDTIVGEHGSRLSGGQRQRLAIARALVREPDFLILDEATAALDQDSEREIVDTLRLLKGKITIILVTHKQHLLSLADDIYNLDKGTLTRVSQIL